MQILTQILAPCTTLGKLYLRYTNQSKTLAFYCNGLTAKKKSCTTSDGLNSPLWTKSKGRAVVSAIEDGNSSNGVQRTRKVVEHICLIKAKDDLSEEPEKDMLDYLYTLQYQMRGIVAISLGRISDPNPYQYTHAIFMRFQTKEDLEKFYKNPLYMTVLEEHVMPYCHGFFNLDYDSEVEEDILAIFRKGEEYNFGVEFMLFVSFVKSAFDDTVEDAVTSLGNLALEFPSLIVQATKGPTINSSNLKYSHAVVIRFRSSEAFKIFMNSPEYNSVWKSKFQPIVEEALSVHFSVDPIGSELM